MVFLKKTELKCKTDGFNNAKRIYTVKIEDQKRVYDKRIEIYERNIKEKDKLINDLKKAIASLKENTGTDNQCTDIVSTFLKCIDVMQKDINVTSQKKSDYVLAANNISTLEKAIESKIALQKKSAVDREHKEVVNAPTSNLVKENDKNIVTGHESRRTVEYDERGFIKNTVRHKNGTKYDDEGYDKFGRDKDGYDKQGFKQDGYHKNGTKYDDKGFDRQHYHINESKESMDTTTASSSLYDERSFIKNTAKHKNGTKYDDEGYDKFGYDINGYNKNGLDKLGHPRKI